MHSKADILSQCKDHSETAESWDTEIRQAFEEEKPVLTHAMVEAINAAHSASYTVTDQPCTTKRELRSMTGRQPGNASMLQKVRETEDVIADTPATFNPDTKWPECVSVIRRQHNQGTCGSCWAFAGTSVLDSRICVASGGKYQGQLSRTVLTSCGSSGDGCQGGWEYYAFNHIAQNGVPTGGVNGCSQSQLWNVFFLLFVSPLPFFLRRFPK